MRPQGVLALTALLLATPVSRPLGAQETKVLSARLVADVDKGVPGATVRLAVVAEIAPGWHVNSNRPNEEYLIPTEVSLAAAPGLTFGAPVYPAHHEVKLSFSETPLALFEKTVVFRFDAAVEPGAAPGPRDLFATVRFQACNDQQCLPPDQVEAKLLLEVAPAGTAVASLNAELFGGVATPAGAAAPPPAGEGSAPADESPLSGKSLPALVALVFLAGLALNLTPCVYPLIPITVGFFGRQAEGKAGKSFGLALAYVLGMSVTYSALGVFAALSGALFGSWLQKPAVLVGIALVVLALALSMFGLFEIQAPHFTTDRTGSKAGVLGALTMGLFVGFVAAPCIGPFVLSLLTYVAAKGSALLGFGLFFTLAMGLGLPYLVLGTATGSLKKLPRSGEWMVVIRKVFGFVLVALAVYFLRPLLPPRIYPYLLAAPLAVGGLYLAFFERSGAGLAWFRWVRLGLAAALLATGVFFVLPSGHGTGLAFEPYSDARLARATAEGKPVLIDFYADWCLPCKELDERTFTDAKVVGAAKGWVLLKADLTRDASPEVARLKERWRILGVPTIVFLGPDGKESAPRVVQYEPPKAFLERLAR